MNLENLTKQISEIVALLGTGPAVVALILQLISLWRGKKLVTAEEAQAALDHLKALTDDAYATNVNWFATHPAE